MNTRSMTVVDEAHTTAGKTLQDLCNLLDREISVYIKILNQVTTDAAKEGRTTTRYQEYASMISGLRGQLERVGTVLNVTATEFPAQIDKADGYLY